MKYFDLLNVGQVELITKFILGHETCGLVSKVVMYLECVCNASNFDF